MTYSKDKTRNYLIQIVTRFAATVHVDLEGRKAGIYASKLNQRKNIITETKALITYQKFHYFQSEIILLQIRWDFNYNNTTTDFKEY